MITVLKIRFNGDNRLHHIEANYNSGHKFMVTDDSSLHIYNTETDLIASYANGQWSNVKKVS